MKNIAIVPLLLASFSLYSMADLLQGIVNNPKYKVDAKVNVLREFAPQINNFEKKDYNKVSRAYTKNLKKETQEQLKFTDFVNKHAQAAPAKKDAAPEGISPEFQKVVEQVPQVDNQEQAVIHILQFLFGEADTNAQIFAGIDNIEQAMKNQPGVRLKESIDYNNNVIAQS